MAQKMARSPLAGAKLDDVVFAEWVWCATKSVVSVTAILLVILALGFVLAHPAVSSAIIGPRTLEQLESQLGVERRRAP